MPHLEHSQSSGVSVCFWFFVEVRYGITCRLVHFVGLVLAARIGFADFYARIMVDIVAITLGWDHAGRRVCVYKSPAILARPYSGRQIKLH